MSDNDDDLDSLRQEIKDWCSSIETKPREPDELKVKFADTFIDSFADMLSKTDEQVLQEEEDHKNKLLNILNSIELSGETIKVFSNGYLFDDEIPESERLGPNTPEESGFKKLDNGKYSWPCSWSDIFLSYNKTQSIWVGVIQNKPSQKDHFETDLRITNKLLQEAFQQKNKEEILLWQEEVKRLQELAEDDFHFRTITLNTEDYLTKQHIITGMRIWITKFYPKLKDRIIDIVECNR